MIQQGASGARAELEFRVIHKTTGPVTGKTWATGELKLRLPGGSVINATVANIVEIGNGGYALQLTAAETATAGKVYYYLNLDANYADAYYTDVIADIAAVVDAVLGANHGTGAWGGGTSASDVAEAVWAYIIESGHSVEQVLRLITGILAGPGEDLDGPNPVFRSLDGSKIRITGETDEDTRTPTIGDLS